MEKGNLNTKHAEVVLDLQDRLSRGVYKTGQQLPSEPLLAHEYGVAYMTIRRAITTLVEQGQLYRVRGRGTYVAEPPSPDQAPSIGLLLLRNWHSIDPFYFPPLVSGFVAYAHEQGHQVHLADRSEPLLEILQFHELHVRAVACVMLEHDDLKDADGLLDRGVMVVAINNYGGLRRVTSVSPNNRKGCYDATKALIELGHRDFMFLAGPRLNLDAIERRRGYEAALRESGVHIRSSFVVETGFLEEAGYEQAQAVLQRDVLPTAIVSVSDLPAIGMMKGLQEAGIRIPRDISIVGFGDFRLSAYMNPALTTVRLCLEEIGRRAAEALIAQYRGGRSETVTIDCPLVWRESVGPPPQGLGF
ncbi:MAG: GntR family transcriptional regulator [Fimbriimonas sp.]|nr:GntR family transcriptional regulator [Fimbriimonas sp.]